MTKYQELEGHLKDHIDGCHGEWVGKKSGYEAGLCSVLGLTLSKNRYEDATWRACSIELKKGKGIWLDLVRYAELLENSELGREASITLFCIPANDKRVLSIGEILGVPTATLLGHLNLRPEHVRLLRELRAHLPRSLNAQASLTVSDVRALAMFQVRPSP